MLIAK